MDRLGTYLIRSTVILIPPVYIVVYWALAPEDFSEIRLAAIWYLKHFFTSVPHVLTFMLSVGVGAYWLYATKRENNNFIKRVKEGAVPQNIIKPTRVEHLAVNTRAMLDPVLTNHESDKAEFRDTLLGAAVDLGAAELRVEKFKSEYHLFLRYGMDDVDAMTLNDKEYSRALEILKEVIGVEECGCGRIELRGKTSTQWLNVVIENSGFQIKIEKRRDYSYRLEDLNLIEPVQAKLNRAIEKKKGLIVLSGAAQSGMASVLYAMAHRVHKMGMSPSHMVLIEPHIRLELPFLLQVEVGQGDQAAIIASVIEKKHDAVFLRRANQKSAIKLALELAKDRLVVVAVDSDSTVDALNKLVNASSPQVVVERLVLMQRQALFASLCDCKTRVELSEEERSFFKEEVGKDFVEPNALFEEEGCDDCHLNCRRNPRVLVAWSLENKEGLLSLIKSQFSQEKLDAYVEENRDSGLLGVAKELAERGDIRKADYLELLMRGW